MYCNCNHARNYNRVGWSRGLASQIAEGAILLESKIKRCENNYRLSGKIEAQDLLAYTTGILNS